MLSSGGCPAWLGGKMVRVVAFPDWCCERGGRLTRMEFGSTGEVGWSSVYCIIFIRYGWSCPHFTNCTHVLFFPPFLLIGRSL